ncbi:MAG: DUF4160 domain-containing protein [Thermomicrobiales bacterium]
MPRLSEFHGIVIQMFHSDHPPLHFHATYGEHGATFGIDPITRLDGRLPKNAERMVLEWAKAHQAELLENWALARDLQPLRSIEPLP